MKRELSLILAVVMLLGCMSVTAFAEESGITTSSGATQIKAIKSSDPSIHYEVVPVTYEMVIPADITITEAGIKLIGTPSVKNVQDYTANTVISYTANGSQLTLEGGSKTMDTSYYSQYPAEELKALSTSSAINVFKNSQCISAETLPSLYVGVTQEDWYKADAGTYYATMTFNFTGTSICPTPTKSSDIIQVTGINGDNVTYAVYAFDGEGNLTVNSGITIVSKTTFKTEIAGVEDFEVGDMFHWTDTYTKCLNPETHTLPSVDLPFHPWE